MKNRTSGSGTATAGVAVPPWGAAGTSRAAVAVGHTILVVADHLLRDGTDDHDLGSRSFDERDRRAVERRLVHQLEDLGDKASLEPAASAAAGARCFQTTLGSCPHGRRVISQRIAIADHADGRWPMGTSVAAGARDALTTGRTTAVRSTFCQVAAVPA